jgi:putative cardiolipin synthase
VEVGYDALLLRVHLIRQARRSIDLQTFIWTNDEAGRLLIYELIQAARRGVRVRIVADHFVSDKDPATVAFLATVHPNLEVRHYRPGRGRIKPSLLSTMWHGLWSFRDFNQRMHNKVLVVDGAALVTGGRNVENTYYDHSTSMNFRDRDVLAVGPVAGSAAASFERYWTCRHVVPSRDLRDVQAELEAGTYRRYETREDFGYHGLFEELDREADDEDLVARRFGARLLPVARVRFMADEPGKKRGLPFSEQARMTKALREVLEQARSTVVVQTPYLVLSDPARQLFRRLIRERGVRVRISSNSFASTDNLLAYSANYRLRNEYVEELGLEIHEFRPRPQILRERFPQFDRMEERARAERAKGSTARPPFLCVHAKSLVVDGRIAYVGSYNLDPRSENLNTEAGLLVEDEAFAAALQAEIERDLEAANSWVIGRRALPLKMEAVNGLVEGLLDVVLGPVDLWPIQNTCSFELREGGREMSPYHPEFHRNYEEAGAFPGAEGLLSTKEIVTRVYKAVGSPLTPIL